MNSTPTPNPVPAITGISPSSSVAGSPDTSVTITGSGFVSSSMVQWNGSQIATTYVSATSLNATIPASSLANALIVQIDVVNPSPGGGTSLPANFAVNNPVPVINRISPAGVLAGSADVLLDVSGSGFVSTTVVGWNGTALTTTFVSTAEVKANLPAANITGSSQDQITVQNPSPGGGASASATFDVNSPIPAITGISPSSVPANSSATITVTGTGFESNSVVLWNGAARPTTVVSATVLQVVLSASDLQNQGSGSLTVSNPGPGASTSAAAQLTVGPPPSPVIQSVTIATAPGISGACPQLQVTIVGQNFAYDSTIQANGLSLPTVFYGANPTTLIDYLPLGFVSAPGALSFTVTNPGQPALVSAPFAYSQTSPAALALCISPSPTTVYAASNFSFAVQPSEVNISGNGSLTLGSPPAGISATNNTVVLPPSGATVYLQAASSTAAGTYDLVVNATVGAASAKGDFNFTINTGTPPSFFFVRPLQTEVGVPIGGSGSIQFGTIVNSSGSVDYDVTPSVTGLPPETTATFTPSTLLVGQSVTITLSAANTAPVTQNASVTLTGTPSASVADATSSFFADVTQPPGSLPGNRTDFVPTAGTPYAAVYDAIHNLIFSINPDWNRVDVISNVTHKILKSVPVRSPRGLDITQDSGHVWVQTASLNIFAIDTVSLQATHYSLPKSSIASSGLPVSFSTDRLLALSDGTLFVFFNDSGSGGGGQVGIWNPQTNQLNVLLSGPITAFGVPVRSGDGSRVYATNDSGYKTGVAVYDVASQTLSTIGSGTAYLPVVAVNHDGSRLVLGSSGMELYDSNLSPLGSLPGTLTGFGPDFPLDGGVLFSADGAKLYEVGVYNGLAVILTIDATSLKVLGIAPAAPTDPVGTSGAAGTATPFAIDAAGIILGVQNYGISFDDSTFYQNYAVNQPGFNGTSEYIATYAGPLAGGTVSSLNVFPDLTPDVWFGQIRGSANISNGQLTFTSPPSTAPGPVNVKFIYPDGEQGFYPQLFSYSTFPEYAVTSGSSPNGGAPAQVLGYGLPQDASGGTLTVGANTATITTTKGQYPPLSGEPYPSTILAYTLPPGTPGWADLQVSTPIGTGMLPKSVFYAKSLTDYSSPDSFTAVLVDEKRNQVYLSAGDHVDVFSTSTNQFLTPLNPAANGTKKQFAGLALTPDGSELLIADLMDGSLAVINPDTPSSTYSIPIVPAGPGVNNCEVGPLYVAAASANLAFVTTGSLPAPSCPQTGLVYVVNLQTHAVSQPAQCGTGLSADASGDGSLVVIGETGPGGGPCLYSAQTASYTLASFPFRGGGFGIAISADGNIVGSNQILADTSLNMVGALAYPIPLYGGSIGNSNPPNLLLRPRLNASGSLYYFSYPDHFEIIDVAHAVLRMRFALTETLQYVASPLAIDSGGRRVFLITDKGLTVVDLGSAPLSIGHLSQQSASPGTQIILRGSGFDSSITATVGGTTASVSVSDENTLTLTVPSAASGPQDIVLTKSDGQSYTLENSVILP